MLDAALYAAYSIFLIVVYLFLSAVIIYRGGRAERWLNFSLEYFFVVILVTFLLFGRVPIATSVFEGLKQAIRVTAGL